MLMQQTFFSSDRLRVYTVEEAAAILHVSLREVRRMIKSREIDIFLLGRKRSLLRIADFSLQEFIRKRIDEVKKSEKS
jgi:excisionase family DNA binding protein